jgi:hydroxylamine reductase (hybrid-cluster protein)
MLHSVMCNMQWLICSIKMLPAHGYPGLKKYKHLVGEWGLDSYTASCVTCSG